MEEKFDFNYVKESSIEINVPFVIRGLQLGLIEKKFVEDFAVHVIENCKLETNKFIELAWGTETEDHAIELLLKILEDSNEKNTYIELPDMLDPKGFDQEMWKWRWIMLDHYTKNYEDRHKLFESVDIIYKEFGFPEDMDSLIYYHPNSSYINRTPEESQKELEDSIHKFTNSQKSIYTQT